MNQETSPEKQGGLKLFRYFKESIVEFKKVVWPKRSDAVRMTGFVLVFVTNFCYFHLWGG